MAINLFGFTIGRKEEKIPQSQQFVTPVSEEQEGITVLL